MTTNITTLDKVIFGSSSIFEKVNVYENIDPEELHNVIHTAKLIEFNGTRHEGGIGKLYKTEKEFLTAYQYIWNEPLGCFVSQWFLKKHGWGRAYPVDNMSISIFHRPTRHTLCDKYLVDVDIINCHYEIILSFMKQLNLSCEEIEKYCENPKGIRELVSIHYNTSLDKAKSLFITLIYGGGLWKWRKDNNIDDSVKDFPMLLNIKTELEEFQKVVIEGNQHILTDILTYEPHYFDDAYEGKRERTLVSFWCQSIERYIQESCIKMLVKKHGLMLNNIVPCQDGFMIRKIDYQDEFIDEVNDFIRDELKLVSKMKQKAFDEKYKIGKPPVNKVFMRFDLLNMGDAQYANYLIEMGTKYRDMVVTGKDKLMISFVYNGVYWEEGSLHLAEFQKGRMDWLRVWLAGKFQRVMMTIKNDPRFVGYIDNKEKKKIEKAKQERQKERQKQIKEAKQERQKQIKEAKQERQKQIKERNMKIRGLTKDNIKLASLKKLQDIEINNETIRRLEEEIKNIEADDVEIDDVEIDDGDDDDENENEKNFDDPVFQNQMIEILNFYTIANNGLKRLSNNVSRKAIAEVFMGILHINEIKWDSDPNLFAFKNCIMDLRTGEMIKPCKEQFIRTTCNWEWNYDYDMTKVDEIQKLIESILPVKVIREYYMLFNSTALTGHKVQKVPINTGTGGNGKSLCRELMTGVVGGYGMEIPSDVLTKPIVSGSPNPVLANMDMKRYLYFSEPEGNRPINSETFKKLSGDRFISARGLYSGNTTVNMIASLAGDANTIPPFTNITQENLKSILRRYVETPFPTTAVTQEEYDLLEDKTNYNVKKNYAEDKYWLDDNRQAMFMVLLEYAKKFIENPMLIDNVPQECIDRTVKHLTGSSVVVEWFNDAFEEAVVDTSDPDPENHVTDEQIMSFRELYRLFKMCPIYDRLNKAEKRQYNEGFFKTELSKSSCIKKGCVKVRDDYHNKEQLKVDYTLVGYKVKV